ncbi:hypothetical protein [Streptomyces sp. Ac-502]|uniref:hypothetical protein n=1 Tax=Streptomyces sp. Ac-502 TaxID=3342801 RepID=UPI0038628E17
MTHFAARDDGFRSGPRGGAYCLRGYGYRVVAHPAGPLPGSRREGQEHRVDEREIATDARDRLADQRERAADARDHPADAREDAADERERLADAQESAADSRERFLDARKSHTDQISRSAGDTVPSLRKRSSEAIGRARALLASSQARLDRTEAALSRTEARAAHERHGIEQEIAASLRRTFSNAGSQQAALESLVERLQARFRTAAAALAEAQDQLARHHERMAVDAPSEADGHRDRAEQARQAARQTREAARS